MSGTDIRHSAIRLLACYAMSGTDIVYGHREKLLPPPSTRFRFTAKSNAFSHLGRTICTRRASFGFDFAVRSHARLLCDMWY
eukprot:993451-Rhodomonas_salina.2